MKKIFLMMILLLTSCHVYSMIPFVLTVAGHSIHNVRQQQRSNQSTERSNQRSNQSIERSNQESNRSTEWPEDEIGRLHASVEHGNQIVQLAECLNRAQIQGFSDVQLDRAHNQNVLNRRRLWTRPQQTTRKS